MSFARLVPFVMVAALGCRLPNPAFEDGDDGSSEDLVADDSSGGESGSSLGESSTVGEDDPGESETASSTTNSSSESESSSDGVDTSSSDGMDMSSSSDGFDTSSSEGMDTSSSSSEGMDTSSDGLDAPIMMCPQVEPAVDCFSCMQNNCCEDIDVDCFNGVDDKCFCTLMCLAEGGDNCALNCGAGQLPANHAAMIHQCGQMVCANFCDS